MKCFTGYIEELAEQHHAGVGFAGAAGACNHSMTCIFYHSPARSPNGGRLTIQNILFPPQIIDKEISLYYRKYFTKYLHSDQKANIIIPEYWAFNFVLLYLYSIALQAVFWRKHVDWICVKTKQNRKIVNV
jgi:hypothetical protein